MQSPDCDVTSASRYDECSLEMHNNTYQFLWRWILASSYRHGSIKPVVYFSFLNFRMLLICYGFYKGEKTPLWKFIPRGIGHIWFLSQLLTCTWDKVLRASYVCTKESVTRTRMAHSILRPRMPHSCCSIIHFDGDNCSVILSLYLTHSHEGNGRKNVKLPAFLKFVLHSDHGKQWG